MIIALLLVINVLWMAFELQVNGEVMGAELGLAQNDMKAQLDEAWAFHLQTKEEKTLFLGWLGWFVFFFLLHVFPFIFGGFDVA